MTDVPRDPIVGGMDDEADEILDDLDEDENKDKRVTKRRFDQYVEKPGELSDSEDEEEGAANGVHRQPGAIKRRNHVSYRDLEVTDSGVDSGLATPREPSTVAADDVDTTGGADTRMEEAPESTETAAESHADQPSAPAIPEEPSTVAADDVDTTGGGDTRMEEAPESTETAAESHADQPPAPASPGEPSNVAADNVEATAEDAKMGEASESTEPAPESHAELPAAEP